jgi:hypothetical protein
MFFLRPPRLILLCQSTQNQSKSICNQQQGDATTIREAGAHRKSPPPTKPSPSPATASRNLASVAIARRPCGSSRAGLSSRLRADDTRRHSQRSRCRREAHAPNLNKAPRVGFTARSIQLSCVGLRPLADRRHGELLQAGVQSGGHGEDGYRGRSK